MPWEKFQAQVRAISAPALIIDQESSEPAGQSAPERMAADMQVSFCPPCVWSYMTWGMQKLSASLICQILLALGSLHVRLLLMYIWHA